MKPAACSATEERPRYWEKRVLVAYLRMMGATQAAAGTAVGRCERTVREWEADQSTWPLAREDARQRWLGELTDAARVALLSTLKTGNGWLALQVLERLDRDLAPPSVKLKHDVELGEGLAALLQEAVGTARERVQGKLHHLQERHGQNG
jgi:hypothetical protein